MTEVCTVNGSTDEFVTEARLVKLVGSWVEAEEAALLREGVVGTAVVMMGTAVAVLVVAAYLRNSLLARGEKAIMYSLQWTFPLHSTVEASQRALDIPTEVMLIERDAEQHPAGSDDQHMSLEDVSAESEEEKQESRKKRKVRVVKNAELARKVKAMMKKKGRRSKGCEVIEEVKEEPQEQEQEEQEQAKERELEQEIEQTLESCLVERRKGCSRRSQSAPSVVFAEPIATSDEEPELVDPVRPATTEPEGGAAVAERIPTPKEEIKTVKLVLGQEPWEVEIDVKETDLNLSAPTVSFLRCKGFITWCRDDIKGDCQWGHRCRYAHVASEELRSYLMTILPPIPPQMCPQDFHCNQLNDVHHQAQYRHTCRIPNCQNATQMWHAIPFHHPVTVPKSMPTACYSYGAPMDMSLHAFESPMIEPVERYTPPEEGPMYPDYIGYMEY